MEKKVKKATHVITRFFRRCRFGFPANYGRFDFPYKDMNVAIMIIETRSVSSTYFTDRNIGISAPRVETVEIAHDKTITFHFSVDDPLSSGYEKKETGCIVAVLYPLKWVEGDDDLKVADKAFEVFQYFHSIFKLVLSRGFAKPDDSTSFTGFDKQLVASKKKNALIDIELVEDESRKKRRKINFYVPNNPHRPKDENFTDDEDITIRERLSIYQPILPYQRILLSALDQFYTYNNFNSAIILFSSSVESLLQTMVISICEFRGQEKLKDGDNFKPVSRVISENINKLYLSHLSSLLKLQKPEDREEYKRWAESAYRLRNKILHRGHQGVTANEAAESYASAKNFIEYLESIFPSSAKELMRTKVRNEE